MTRSRVGKTENSSGRLTCIAVNRTSIDAEMLSVIRISSRKLGNGITSITTTAVTARGRASIPKLVPRGKARIGAVSANGLPLTDGVTVCPGRSLTGRWPSWLLVPNGRVVASICLHEAILWISTSARWAGVSR